MGLIEERQWTKLLDKINREIEECREGRGRRDSENAKEGKTV